MNDIIDFDKLNNEIKNLFNKIRSTKDIDEGVCADKFILQISRYIDKNKEENLSIKSFYETNKGNNKTAYQLVKFNDISMDE